MSKRDDVSTLYRPTNALNNLTSVLFYVNIIASVISLAVNEDIKKYIFFIQIIIAVISVCLSVADDYFYWYEAESARRKSSIENAFDIDLTNLVTEGYYNNNLAPSIIKYSLNSFESVFFSKNIAKKMMFNELLKSLGCIIIFVVACLEIDNKEFLLLITQTLFSAQFILGAIALIIYHVRLQKLYDEYYREFITHGITTNKQVYSLLACSVEYEAIKAHYKIRLSSKIYNKINPALTTTWNDISRKVIVKNDSK